MPAPAPRPVDRALGDHRDGALGEMDQLVRDAAEQRPGAPEAARADDDLVGLAGGGDAGDRMGGTVGDHLDLPVDALEVLLERLDARLGAVEHDVEETLVVGRADPVVGSV